MAARGGVARWAAFAVVLAVLAPAASAWACPMCALNDKAGLGSWFILAGMIGTPFVVVGTAILIMRKIGASSVSETAEKRERSQSALAMESSTR